jgi:hypothetical protein
MLAVDPGGTTGWVLMEDRVVKNWGEEKDPIRFLDMTWDLLREGLDRVVCERWILMRGRVVTNQPTALEIIGCLKWQAWYTETTFLLQNVADAKAWATPSRLAPYRFKGVGRGGEGHAISALSHALLHLGPETEDTDDADHS